MDQDGTKGTAQRTNEQVFRALFEHALDAVLIANDAGCYVLANAAAANLLGVPLDKLITRRIEEFLIAPSGGFDQLWREFLYKGEMEGEIALRRSDGVMVDVHFRALANFVPGLHLSILRDITERKLAEKALRESEERFRLFVENVREYALVQVDTAGTITGWNPGAERLFGYAEPEILGQPVAILFPRDCENGEPGQGIVENHTEKECWLVRRDGSQFFARWITDPMYDSDGQLRGFAKVLRDETERKSNDAERERYQQLERDLLTRQVQSTGEALERSHEELRALAVRLMSVQEEERRHVARELHDDLAQRLALLEMEMEQIRREPVLDTTRLNQLLGALQGKVGGLSEDVRRLSHRLHPSILEDLGLEAALRHLVQEFEHARRAPVCFTAHSVARFIPLSIATALYRIAQGALRNVIKHAPEAVVLVELSHLGSAIRLTVEDDGPGFAMGEIRDRGTGLGLISMHERAHGVGGELAVRSVPGDGTQITVTIPLPDNMSAGRHI